LRTVLASTVSPSCKVELLPATDQISDPEGTLLSRYAVVFEKSNTGYGAYIPDLPGCVAVGRSLEETKRLIHEAMEIHLASMREDGDPIPEPSLIEYVEA
jgi:predicted RNase H-like HicB family nuclease